MDLILKIEETYKKVKMFKDLSQAWEGLNPKRHHVNNVRAAIYLEHLKCLVKDLNNKIEELC